MLLADDDDGAPFLLEIHGFLDLGAVGGVEPTIAAEGSQDQVVGLGAERPADAAFRDPGQLHRGGRGRALQAGALPLLMKPALCLLRG